MSKKNISIALMILCAVGALINLYVAVVLVSWIHIAFGLVLIVCYVVNMRAYNEAIKEK